SEGLTMVTGVRLFNLDRATGWAFTPTENLLVSALGVWDEHRTGFASEHDVGLFFMDGTPIASTTIHVGTGSELFGQSRYEAITPVTLSAGPHPHLFASKLLICPFLFAPRADGL